MSLEYESEIPESLPLLESLGNTLDIEGHQPFKGYTMLAVQHLLGSSVPFFEMLERGGARPEDVHIVGKAYSSHPGVVNRLIRHGYNLTFNDVFSSAEDRPYDTILEEHILAACQKMAGGTSGSSERKNLLIIDDGGKALKLIQGSFATRARFVGVEQTSRGARLLAPLELSFPVVNVARSDSKTIYESPMIAHAMVSELLLSLDRWETDGVFHLSEKRAFLLGYGYIGEQVAKELLDHGFHVAVYDTDSDKAALAAQNPDFSRVSKRTQAYPDASLIVGCTGAPSIPEEEFKLIKPGSLLTNMASTDTEFSAWKLRKKENIVHTHVLPSDERYLQEYSPLPWRSLYRCHEGDTHFYLANGGFPIDFSGSVNPIPADNIQLTTALLLAAAVQAVHTEKPGLIALHPDIQDDLVAQYLKIHQQPPFGFSRV